MGTNHLERLRRMLEQVDPSGTAHGLEATLESQSAGTEGPTLDVKRVSRDEAEIALEGLDVLKRGEEVDEEQRFVLEAIVMPYYRPVVDIIDDRMKTEQLTKKWQHLSSAALRPGVEECLLSVGRINVPNLPSLPYAGTGFVVGPGLMMTNRHVAQIFARGLGARNLQFQPGQAAAVDFYHETGRTASFSLDVEKVVMIHPYWDMALLKVNGLPENRKPLALSTTDPAELLDREVVVVGYPGYDPTPDDDFQRVQSRIFRSTYYVKRLQPGLLKVRRAITSFRRTVDAVTHDCSTLGGNSGSAVLALPRSPADPVQLVGLHFAGEYLEANYAVPTFDLAQDGRVVDTGVNFVSKVASRGDVYDPYWREAEAGESAVAAGSTSRASVQSPPAGANPPLAGSAAAATFTIPLQVTISFGNPTVVTTPIPAPGDARQAPPLITASVSAPVRARREPVEGLFGREPFRPTADLPHPFSLDSLSVSGFAWPAALSMALASRLAYEEKTSVENTARNRWRMQECEFIEADDTQCFVAWTTSIALVAFRGTESLGDWLADLNILSSRRSYGTVHRGFLMAFQAVEPQLRRLLAGLPHHTLVMTGHSLGGALATIAAAEWSGTIPVARLYTFGQPAVGKTGFPAFFQQKYPDRLFRFVNDDDIVPRVPPTYQHVGRLFHFDPRGNLETLVGSPLLEAGGAGASALPAGPGGPPMMSEDEFDRLRARLLQERANRRAPATRALEAPMVEGLLPSVSDHSIDLYIAKIAARAGT